MPSSTNGHDHKRDLVVATDRACPFIQPVCNNPYDGAGFMGTIINALLPVFVTLLLVYLVAWHHNADSKSAGVLSKLEMTFTLPLSLFGEQ